MTVTTLYPLGGAVSPCTEVKYWEGGTYMAAYTYIAGVTTTHDFDHLDLYVATKKNAGYNYWAYQTQLVFDVSGIPPGDSVSEAVLSMALRAKDIDNDFTVNVYWIPNLGELINGFVESDNDPYPSTGGLKVASINTADVVAGQNAFTSNGTNFATAVAAAVDSDSQFLYLSLVSSRQEAEIQEAEGDNSEISFKAEDHAEGQTVYPKLTVTHTDIVTVEATAAVGISFSPSVTSPDAPLHWSSYIIINNNDETTDDRDVIITVHCVRSDSVTPDEMRFTEDLSSWPDWEPYAETKAFRLSLQDGTEPDLKVVYADFRQT